MSNLEHGEWGGETLTPEQIVTQCMDCSRFRHPDGNWSAENPMPGAPISHGICPEDYDKRMQELKMLHPDFQIPPYQAKTASGIPATYSPDDPLDMGVVNQLVDDLHTAWWLEPPDVQRQAIANAFRAALVSPRQNLKWNSIVYQDMMDIPPDEQDPEQFEQTIRERKQKWDRFGQQTLDMIHENSEDPEHINYGNQIIERYMPGIWQNVRNASLPGAYIEDLRRAALEDIGQGGDGRHFREELLNLDIPGVGPKIAAFVWLLLAPKTSKIATIDVHMMRHLGQPVESPKDYASYLQFENQLDEQRKNMGYNDVPLGAFQWALWDKQRSPGYHQDHTPLRPLNPTDWRNVDWAPQQRTRKQAPPEVSPDQQSLFGQSRWKRKSWATTF